MGDFPVKVIVYAAATGILLFIGFQMFPGDSVREPDPLIVRLAEPHLPIDKSNKKTEKIGLVPELSANAVKNSRVTSSLEIWKSFDGDEPVILERAHPIIARRIELDRVALDSLRVGDAFILHIPQTARRLSATVKNRVRNQHSETILARVHVLERAFTVQFTISETSVYGNIETPEGVYILEQQSDFMKGVAVIFSEREIYQNLEYTESDAIPLGI